MKKWFSIILILFLLGSLAACNENPAVSGGDHSDWVWVRDNTTNGALSDTGFYYVDV